jgi:hypothetical protein
MLSDFHTHPFYKPLWRRVAIVASLGVWTAFEMYIGSSFFLVIAAALFAYCGWNFLVTYPKQDAE